MSVSRLTIWVLSSNNEHLQYWHCCLKQIRRIIKHEQIIEDINQKKRARFNINQNAGEIVCLLCSAVRWDLEEDTKPFLGVLTEIQPMTAASDDHCCRVTRNVFYPFLFVFIVFACLPWISEPMATIALGPAEFQHIWKDICGKQIYNSEMEKFHRKRMSKDPPTKEEKQHGMISLVLAVICWL